MKVSRPLAMLAVSGFLFLLPSHVAGWTAAECSKVSGDNVTIGRLVSRTSSCMSRGAPVVTSAVLLGDRRVVQEAYPSLRSSLTARGFREADAARVTALSWTQFRSKNPNAHMDTTAFLAVSMSFGKLTVKSSPEGASIEVDAQSWENKTNTADWTAAGKRRVRLTRNRCAGAEGTVDVPAGGEAEFERTLVCK